MDASGRAILVEPKVEVVELTEKPQNTTTTHIFVDLCQPTFLAGKPCEGVVVLVVQEPVRVQRLCLVWKGLEHVSWWQGMKADQNVTGTEWWVARRLHLIPDDGSASGNKSLEPGTYTFPFVTTLREDLPGSYQESKDQGPELNLTNGVSVIDKASIEYSVTAQCDFTRPDNSTEKVSAVKGFNVVEAFPISALLEQASVRKVQNTFFFGGPLTGVVWVANKGNFLFGAPLSVKIDILNKSPYTIEKVLLSVWEHKTLKGQFENKPQTLTTSTKIQEMVVNESNVASGIETSKTVKFVVKAPCASLTKAKLLKVTYELQAQYVYLMDSLEIKVPIRAMGVCPQLIPDLPKSIPVNLTNDKAEELHNRQYVDELGAGIATY